MKKVVLLIIIFIISTSTGVWAQPNINVALNVTFLDDWAVYSMADWEGYPELYTLRINNLTPEEVKYIFLEMTVNVYGCADESIPDGQVGWAVTRALTLPPNSLTQFNNNDYFRETMVQQEDYNTDFEDAIENAGNTLPAGTYIYTFRLLYDESAVPYYEQAEDLDQWFNTTVSEDIVITQPNDPELVSPGDPTDEGLPMYESNPVFQWLSTGAQSGAYMYFRMVVCNKEEGQSNDEAIDNLPFFVHEFDAVVEPPSPYLPWIVMEQGVPNVMSFPYPSSEESFTNGKYVWQIQAKSKRNVVDPSSGFEGISEIYCFQYGDIPQPIYPPDDAEIQNLTPSFTWTMAMGAQGYLIRLSGDDDPMVENNYFEEEVSATFIDHVPGNQVLVPNSRYYWKIRALPVGYWSVPVSFMVLAPGSGLGEGPELAVIVNPMDPQHPTFIWDMVSGASSYQLYVNDSPEMTSSIWDFNTTLTSVIYPDEATGLTQGSNYYAWVQPLDDQGESFGEPSAPSSFEIPEDSGLSPTVVNPVSPVNASIYSSIPVFTWESLAGAVNYGIFVYSNADMSEVLWATSSVPSTSVTYPGDAVNLQFGNTYFWQVVGINSMGEEMGDRSELVSFDVVSVIPSLVYPVGDMLENLLPNFSWEFIDGVSSFLVEVALDQGFSNIIWSTNEVVTNSVGFPVTGVPELTFGATYWWRVTALNEEGAPLGDASEPASFTTPTGDIILELLFGP